MNFQFYLSKKPKPIFAHYKCCYLEKSGYNFYYCPKIHIKFLTHDTLLVGGPCIGEEQELIASFSKVSTLEDLVRCTDKWIGRWLLIWNSYILSDCWSSITLYWNRAGEDNECGILASVPGLLYKACELKGDSTSTNQPHNNSFIERLYADDALYLHQGIASKVSIAPRFISHRQDINPSSSSKYFSHIVEFLKKSDLRKSNYWVGLTAGKDSRLTLCMLKKAGFKVETYTFLKSLMTMSLGDILLPTIVALIIRCRHIILKVRKFPNQIENLRPIEEGLGSKYLSDQVPGSVAYYAARDCYHHITRDPCGIMVISLYYDLITGTLANYLRTPEYWNSIGLSLQRSDYHFIMENGHRSFGGITNLDFLSKGFYYWQFKQRLVHETCVSLELLGIRIFCPGICAELVNNHLDLTKQDLIQFKTIRLWLNKQYPWLRLIPYHLIIQEPRIYVNLIKRHLSLLF